MIRPHNPNATATAFIKGLAIASRNEAQSKWEVRFLRNCGHYPQIRIKELDRRSGRVLSDVRTYEIASGDSLSITVADASAETKPRHTTGGSFDRRNAGHDPQDLRWMLDIDKLHGKKTRDRNNPVETNVLSISDGCFYTGARARGVYRKRWVDGAGGRSPAEPIAGLTGRTFGVDFEGRSVTIEVRGDGGFTETLAHKPDSRYEIVFDNTCYGENRPAPGETDFQDYYKLIDDSEGRVELLPPEKTITIMAMVTAESDDDGSPPAGGGDGPAEDDGEDDPPKEPACHAVTSGEGEG